MNGRKTPWEDHLLERKTEGDLKDLRPIAKGLRESPHVADV